jgi:DNA-binding SARP family transcriptional activator/tetratricopeptide (TPR) repeat protein
LEFCILRPLLVRADDGNVQHIPQLRHRAILSMLLLANKPVAPARIIQALWGSPPPRAAAVTLRAHISSIRRLGPLSSRLETSSAGYQVRVTCRELDLTAFREDAAAGRAALESGDCEIAAPLLQHALDYWDDPALDDLPCDPELGIEAERLNRERLSVRHSWVDARLALGDHHELIPLLETWAVADPLDEHLWAQLILALYRSGRQVDALAAYSRIRTILSAECGLDPGRELRYIQRLILSRDPALDMPSRLLAPGSRRPWPREITPRPSPPLSVDLPTPALICQLPPDASHFTGRAAELAELAELLVPAFSDHAPPIVAITGVCGSGKTALALHSAHMLRDRFPDGQLFIPVRGSMSSPRSVADLLGDALLTMGVPEHLLPDAPGERAALFRSQTAGRRILMVLDDCGIEGCAPLIPADGRSAVIMTTRRLPSDLPVRHIPMREMRQRDAEELLGRVAGRRLVDSPVAGLLANMCDSLPLAVRIVGAGLADSPTWPLQAATKLALRERERLEQAGARNAAVRAAISVSYQSLDERAARALRLMAMISAHDVDGWVIAALLGDPVADDVADGLVQRGLLVSSCRYGGGRRRYELPEPVDQHAAEYLDREPAAARQAAWRRLLTGWLELADLADRSLPRPPGSLFTPRIARRTVIPEHLANSLVRDPVAWFAAEHRGLAAAVEDAARAGDFLVAGQLISYQTAFLYYHERLGAAVDLWQTIVRHANTMGDRAAAARARFHEATVLFQLGEHDRSRSLLEPSMPELEWLGDGRALALGEYLRSVDAAERGQLGNAQQHAEAGLHLARQAGDPLTETLNLSMLGLARARLGHHRLGELYCGQAVSLARSVNEPSYERLAVATLNSLAAPS